MCLKMLSQIRDPLTEQSNLDLGGPSVFFVQAVLVNDALFCADREWHETISFLLFAALYSGAHARVNVQSHHKADPKPLRKRNVAVFLRVPCAGRAFAEFRNSPPRVHGRAFMSPAHCGE